VTDILKFEALISSIKPYPAYASWVQWRRQDTAGIVVHDRETEDPLSEIISGGDS